MRRAARAVVLAWLLGARALGEAAEDGRYWLEKSQTAVSDSEALRYRFRALVVEPGVKTIFDASQFEYLPGEDLLTRMRMGYWRAHLDLEPSVSAYQQAAAVLAGASAAPRAPADVLANHAYLVIMGAEAPKTRSPGWGRALELLEGALQRDAEHAASLTYLVRFQGYFPVDAYERVGRRAVDRAPRNAMAHHALALAQLRKGDRAAATRTYEQGAAQADRAESLLHALGRLHAETDPAPSRAIDAWWRGALAGFGLSEPAVRRKYEELAGGSGTLRFVDARYPLLRVMLEQGRAGVPSEEGLRVACAALRESAKYWARRGSTWEAHAALGVGRAIKDPACRSMPDSLGWSEVEEPLARADFAKRDFAAVIRVTGPRHLEKLAFHEAYERAKAGTAAYERQDFARARGEFAEALRLAPNEPLYWWSLGRAALAQKAYADAALAYDVMLRLAPLPRPFGLAEGPTDLTVGHYREAGFARAIAGDYGGAAAVFEKGTRAFPSDQGLYEWLLVAAFASGGLGEAEAVWSRRPGQAERRLTERERRLEIIGIVDAGLADLGARAERHNMLYAALDHYSRAHAAAAAIKGHAREWSRTVRAEYFAKIVPIYRRLPLKPIPAPEAARHARAAERSVDHGDLRAASEQYRKALDLAPWWPEGHYNLGLVIGLSGLGRRELEASIELAPDGPLTAQARQRLATWNRLLADAARDGIVARDDLPFLLAPDRE